MNNSNISLPINKATVTAVHEFKSFKGYGVDFFIEAQTSNGTVYLQVVTYDDMARSYCQYIHAGDEVQITGALKVKTYQKKDGTAGTALVIERPVSFSKIVSSNSSTQSPQTSTDESKISSQATNAVPATAETDEDNYWDDTEFWADVEAAKQAEKDQSQDAYPDEDEFETPY